MTKFISAIYEGNGILKLSQEVEELQANQQVMIMVIPAPSSDEAMKLEVERIGFEGLCDYLKENETRYNLSSAEFYRRFRQGEMGDADDFILWAGAYEIYLRIASKQPKASTQ